MQELFVKYADEVGCEFGLVANKTSRRADLHAMMLLDKILPGKVGDRTDYGAADMVACAENDQIWLEVGVQELAPLITEEQIKELACCGVWYDGETDCLSMFV
jgi:hypothetical protein